MPISGRLLVKKPSHILVADDKNETRDLLSQLLENDYLITLAADGSEAIACIERERPDLLILDLMMPRVDGFAVLKYLAAHRDPFLPVIVRSAVTQRASRLKALTMGAHEFLGSPFDEEELRVRIETMLALREARKTAERRASELEKTVTERPHLFRSRLQVKASGFDACNVD